MSIERTLAYRESIDLSRPNRDQVHYALANQALDAARSHAMTGREIDETTLQGIRSRLEMTARATAHSKPFLSLRSRVLAAYVKPIVYADVTNIPLSDAEARNLGNNLDLAESYRSLTEIAQDALTRYDALPSVPYAELSPHEQIERSDLSGIISEITGFALPNRSLTGKLFAVPTTAFDDYMSTNRNNHVDGALYDQRKKGTIRRKNPYQIKTSSASSYTHPVITDIDMANQHGASAWPHNDQRFTTLRKLVDEANGEILSDRDKSTLDRLSGFVIRKVLA